MHLLEKIVDWLMYAWGQCEYHHTKVSAQVPVPPKITAWTNDGWEAGQDGGSH